MVTLAKLDTSESKYYQFLRSPNDLLKYKIPLTRHEDHLLVVMILHTLSLPETTLDPMQSTSNPAKEPPLPAVNESNHLYQQQTHNHNQTQQQQQTRNPQNVELMSPTFSHSSFTDDDLKKQKRYLDPRLIKQCSSGSAEGSHQHNLFSKNFF